MSDLEYHLEEEPLYTEKAIEFLENRQDSVDQKLADGAGEYVTAYAFLQGETESLQDYREAIQPYHEFLSDAYDSLEVPRTVVLERVEEDADLMARERDSRLDHKLPSGEKRREALDEVMPSDLHRPVLTDTWIMRGEAEKLREHFTR